jgi:group II intron reverse transcriptase/maturase
VSEGNTAAGANGEPAVDPAQSKTPHTRGNSLDGNREVPQASAADGAAERPEKVADHTSGMYARGKSDSRVVPMKPSNKGLGPAEAAEGRRPTKGNTDRPTASRTQSRTDASSGLDRVRDVARRDKCARFTALLHHVTVDLLRDSFSALKRNAAPGVDGLTWRQYEADLEDRLMDLHARVHSGTYRVQPSKRAYIPKPDGRLRPLGIAALEDKIVQQAVVTVLQAVYEADFLGFSYGFRPGRGPHDALDALWVGITIRKVNWVLDADIRGFFDTIDHGWMLKFLEHRIADRRMLRLIRKWLAAGVSEDGRWSKTTAGTPQGAVISPLLANVYLHYVLDLWVQWWRTHSAAGDVVVVRYADDFVFGFQHRNVAERFLKELRERMGKFGLDLHPDKTRFIEFGRYAAKDRAARGEGKPETFDFLGFTHVAGRTRLSRKFYVWRFSSTVRLRARLRELKETLLRQRHRPIPEQGARLRRVVQGWFNYHAVPGNYAALQAFRKQTVRHWLRALRRRSQRSRMPWSRFGKIADAWIPGPKILHPYPGVRFNAKHPR